MPSTADVEVGVYRGVELPVRYAGATVESFAPSTPSQSRARAAIGRLVRWLTQTPGDPGIVADGVVLLGPPGVGKSHLAAAACREVEAYLEADFKRRQAEHVEDVGRMEKEGLPYWDLPKPHRRRPPLWVNVPSLVVDLRAEISLGADEQDRTRFARRLRTHSGLVVLDDLGREKISDWTGELIYTIVNDRYEAQLPTIATSNLSPEELTAAGYWPAISRIAEGGEIVVVQGRDYRINRAPS